MTIISPETIHVEKFIESCPKTDSQALQGSISRTTIASPATVYATRSGTRTSRANGTRLMIMSDDAQHQRSGRVPRRDHEQGAEREADGAQQDRAAPAHDLRLGQVPDRRGDRHRAHPPGGERDDDEGEHHAEREGDEEALPREGELDLEACVLVLRPERPGHQEDHPVGDDRPEDRPDRRGDDVVRRALEREHLGQVPATRPDRAGDAELATPLGGEHHEDEEDQEDPRGDRERAERREERHERASRLVGGLDRVLLDRLHLERMRLEGRPEPLRDLVGERDGARARTAVRDHHAEHVVGAPVEHLRLREREQHCGVRGGGALELDDVPHLQVGRTACGIRDHRVARPRAELVGRVGVQVRLAGGKIRERDLPPVRADDRGEPVHHGRVGAEEHRARLALARPRQLHGHVVDDDVQDAVGELRAEPRLDLAGDALREPPDPARVAEVAGDVVHGAFRRDDLVRLAERSRRGRADGVAHRVAGDERRRDDGRAQHQPENDEPGPRAATAEVAHAEPDEHGVADREQREDPECDSQPDREDDEQGVERDPEELVHDSTVTLGISA